MLNGIAAITPLIFGILIVGASIMSSEVIGVFPELTNVQSILVRFRIGFPWYVIKKSFKSGSAGNNELDDSIRNSNHFYEYNNPRLLERLCLLL